MAKRRNSSDTIIAASFNWDLCLYCQNVTKGNLRCFGLLVREGHDSASTYWKIAQNIEQFENLYVSQINLRFLENDKSSLAKTCIGNKAKFHKYCGNKFSDLKLERARKRLNKDDSNDNAMSVDDNVNEGNCGRRKPMRATCSEVSKCFFCNSAEGDLHKVLTFQLERKVKQCATILEDNTLLGKLGAGDMVVKDAMYHSKCLLALYKRSKLVFLMTMKMISKNRFMVKCL